MPDPTETVDLRKARWFLDREISNRMARVVAPEATGG